MRPVSLRYKPQVATLLKALSIGLRSSFMWHQTRWLRLQLVIRLISVYIDFINADSPAGFRYLIEPRTRTFRTSPFDCRAIRARLLQLLSFQSLHTHKKDRPAATGGKDFYYANSNTKDSSSSRPACRGRPSPAHPAGQCGARLQPPRTATPRRGHDRLEQRAFNLVHKLKARCGKNVKCRAGCIPLRDSIRMQAALNIKTPRDLMIAGCFRFGKGAPTPSPLFIRPAATRRGSQTGQNSYNCT